jgi:erythronate-4-phosphate dehydrogenase
MKIFVDENIPQGQEAFSPYGEVNRFAGRKLKASDLGDCQALIVRSITQIHAGLLAGSQVRFVGTATIGTDHVDQAWLAQNGIAFASAPGCNANSVSEYVMAALLELQLSKGLRLEGATLGIVGYGHVGKKVRAKAEALGLKVLLCDPPLQDQGVKEHFHPYSYLLEHCDILSLHVPLTISGVYRTQGLFNLQSLAAIAKPLTLLNTCRGEVIEAQALTEGKKSGKIAHLVLDVFPGEPNPPPEVWRSCDILTPHIAGYSLQGKMGGTQQVLEAFCQTFQLPSPSPLREPEPAIPHIDLTTVGENAWPWDFFRTAVRHAYPILDDDMRLRKVLAGENPALGFDLLRRDYPIRHEFKKYLVKGYPLLPKNVLDTLSSWGFRVV